MISKFWVLAFFVLAAFVGTGVGVAYAVAKPKYEERLARNRAEVFQVFGTPCYINKGTVSGNELQRASAILVEAASDAGTVETLFVTFLDSDIVFSDTPPVGLCGSPNRFWVLDGEASFGFDEAVTRKLTPPEEYCGIGAVYGFGCFAVLFVACFTCLLCGGCRPCFDCYTDWRYERKLAHLSARIAAAASRPSFASDWRPSTGRFVTVLVAGPDGVPISLPAATPAEELPSEPRVVKNETV